MNTQLHRRAAAVQGVAVGALQRRTADQMLLRPAATQRSPSPGKEYGSGSSRDWAAKGTLLLGIKAVIAESYERIHRSNLVGMGVLPLQFLPGQGRAGVGLDGSETFEVVGLSDALTPGQRVTVRARRDGRGDDRVRGHRYASTAPSRSSITGTAASCSTSCANCCGLRNSIRGWACA